VKYYREKLRRTCAKLTEVLALYQQVAHMLSPIDLAAGNKLLRRNFVMLVMFVVSHYFRDIPCKKLQLYVFELQTDRQTDGRTDSGKVISISERDAR